MGSLTKLKEWVQMLLAASLASYYGGYVFMSLPAPFSYKLKYSKILIQDKLMGK